MGKPPTKAGNATGPPTILRRISKRNGTLGPFTQYDKTTEALAANRRKQASAARMETYIKDVLNL